MDANSAKAKAQTFQTQGNVPAGYQITSAEKRIIELLGPSGSGPTLVRDCLVWVVRFSRGISWIDLAIDDASGQIVRLERSR